MGNMENQFGISGKAAVGRAGELCIIASDNHIADLRAAPALKRLGAITYLALDPAAPLPQDLLRSLRVLVIEVDPGNPDSLVRVRHLREGYPDLKVIVAIAQASVSLVRTLVRQGIFDVTELPFNPDELASQILDASSADAAVLEVAPLAPLYLVSGSTGGVGATSTLTHLAAALAEADKGKRRVCVADLDLQSGEVAAYAGVATPVTISALIEAGDRLDDELVSSALLETRHGFSVVAAPDAILPLDIVDSDHIDLIVTALRRKFDIVLLDLPAAWTNWSLSLATGATGILVVADSSISSLKQARRRIDLFESIGVSRDVIKVVANRTERRLFRTVGTEDIAHALRAEVIATLSDEGAALRAAQDQGALLQETVGRNAFVKSIEALADHLLEGGH
jgi:pilus assembly protein CpaE